MESETPIDDTGVIIPAINTTSSTAAVRSLGKHNLTTIVISEYESPPAFSSKYCDERITVSDPSTNLDAYEQDLLSLAQRDDVQTILPFREADIYVLSRNKDAFDRYIGSAWPSIETLGTVQDRVNLFAAARAADVAMPRTETLEEWTNWERECIVKPRYTVHSPAYSNEFAEATVNPQSARYIPPNTEPDHDAIIEEMGHVPLVQELVPTTDEYGFFALYEDGSPVATFQHRQRRGWKYHGGPSAFRESIYDPDLEATGRRLLDELEWNGVAMVEFLRDPETEEYKLMEVNPRFWSSLPFTVQVGADFPYLYWLQATGQPLDGDLTYQVGEAGHYLWGELLHLSSIRTDDNPLVETPSLLGTLGEIGLSILRYPRFDYLDLDDPGPFVRDLSNKVETHGAEWLDSKPFLSRRPHALGQTGLR